MNHIWYKYNHCISEFMILKVIVDDTNIGNIWLVVWNMFYGSYVFFLVDGLIYGIW